MIKVITSVRENLDLTVHDHSATIWKSLANSQITM